MLRKLAICLAIALAMPLCLQASEVTISQPTVETGEIINQTARVYDSVNDQVIWYWCVDSVSEGPQFFKHIGPVMPALNDNDPAWTQIDRWYYFDDLCEWGPYGGPATDAEQAYLTGTLAYTTYAGSFEMAYWYICWSTSLEDLQALSVLYSE